MINKKSQNIQASDIAQKAGLKCEDADLICMMAEDIKKYSSVNDDDVDVEQKGGK